MTRTMQTARRGGHYPFPARSPPRPFPPREEPPVVEAPRERIGKTELDSLDQNARSEALKQIEENTEPSSSKHAETRSAKRKRLAGESSDQAGEGEISKEMKDGGSQETKRRTRFGNGRNAKKVKAVAQVDEEEEEAQQRIKDWRKETQEVEEEAEELE